MPSLCLLLIFKGFLFQSEQLNCFTKEERKISCLVLAKKTDFIRKVSKTGVSKKGSGVVLDKENTFCDPQDNF